MTRREAGLEGPLQARIDEAIAKQEVIFRDSFPGALGVRIVEASAGRAVGVLDVGPSVKHPGGYAHGGAIAGFGDTVAAWATFPALGPDEVFTTIEFKANFIIGVQQGRLRAEASVVHRGRRTMVIEVRIFDDADAERAPVAIMLVTQAIINSKGAQAEEVPPDR